MIRAAAAAAALLLLSGADGCCGCASSGSYERRAGAAATPGAPVSLTPPLLRALHFGDFGEEGCQQAAVAEGMTEANRRARFDVAFSAGDNLYPCGPDWRVAGASSCAFAADGATVAPGTASPADPAFRERFEAALAPIAATGVPVFLALGNHDVATWTTCLPTGDAAAVARTKACLEVAHRAKAWDFPARHYVLDRGPARFIVLDTNVVAGDYGGFTLDDEVAFLEASVVGCDAKPCFVVAHHPPATAGKHASDFDAAFGARMDRLVAAAGPDLRGWLAGHDHDLQHLRTAAGLDVFISGNGARERPDERFASAAPAGAALLYGTVRWGHAELEVSATGYAWRAVDHTGEPRHCCVAVKGGTWTPCEPVRCR